MEIEHERERRARVVFIVTCPRCGTVAERLCWPEQRPIYCSARCGVRGSEHRRRRRKRLEARTARRVGAISPETLGDPEAWRLAFRQRVRVERLSFVRNRCRETSKFRYHSAEEAWLVCFYDFPQDEALTAYPCGQCQGFHLGHDNPNAHRGRRLAMRAGFEAMMSEVAAT